MNGGVNYPSPLMTSSMIQEGLKTPSFFTAHKHLKVLMGERSADEAVWEHTRKGAAPDGRDSVKLTGRAV